MQMERSYPAGEIAAEQADQFGNGKIEERGLARGLEIGGEVGSKISFDLRPPEGPEVIGGRPASVGAPEQATILLEFSGVGERQEQLIGQSERQACRRLGLRGQARRESDFLFGQQRAGK